MADAHDREQQLRQLAHDVQQCLHVISMATELLKDARGDDRQFEEICAAIQHERRQAADFVTELLAVARRV